MRWRRRQVSQGGEGECVERVVSDTVLNADGHDRVQRCTRSTRGKVARTLNCVTLVHLQRVVKEISKILEEESV